MGPCLLGAMWILLALRAAGGAVVGTVRDSESGDPVAGAQVALSEVERTVATDSAGRYALREVPAGPHHLAVRCLGYAARSLHALVPREGEVQVHVILRREPVRLPAVMVRAPLVIRGVEGHAAETFPGREISMAAVANHPLLAEPEAFQALSGGEVAAPPETPGGVHIRGGGTDQTAYLLDGVPVLSPYHAAGMSSAWSPDALARLDLTSAWPATEHPHALSGTVDAVTRTPGEQLRVRGGASTTQWRVAADGPLGAAGYLVSLRSGLHDVIAPRHETSYLAGGTGDGLAKLELPLLGGRARLLGYGNANRIEASSAPETSATPATPRNRFEWESRSFGAEWRRGRAGSSLRLAAWAVSGETRARWAGPLAPVDLDAIRRDAGLSFGFERGSQGATTTATLRLERLRTTYEVESDSIPALSLKAPATIATAIASHTRTIGARGEIDAGASLAALRRTLYPGPWARLRWNASGTLAVIASASRTHQFAQSLRNAESIVGHVFPAEAWLGAGAEMPVARSDLGVIAADYRPAPGIHLGLQAYARRSRRLALVAPRDGEPFTTSDFAIGSGAAHGVAAEAAVRSARYGLLASYGWQRIRLEYGDSSYVPAYGARHLLEGGVIVFPAAATSVRLGVSAAFGRRTTTVPGGIEWESCNLLDQGCEFAGSPHYGSEPLGATPLPTYCRVDLGLRQHWHVGIGGRDGLVGVFGTFTNLLGRKNLLTYARDPASGEPIEIELRPPGMLVVGLDWRF